MVYTFASVSAAVGMQLSDYYQQGRRCWVRLHEKGGRLHQVPANSRLELAIDEYFEWLGRAISPSTPLFQSCSTTGLPIGKQMSRHDAIRMFKRRSRAAGLSDSTCCHTFRATGATAYLRDGGTLETALAIAAHNSTRTTCSSTAGRTSSAWGRSSGLRSERTSFPVGIRQKDTRSETVVSELSVLLEPGR